MTTLFIIGGILLTIMIVLFIFVLSIKFDQDHNAKEDSVHYKLFNILRFGEEADLRPKTICSYYWRYIQYIVSIPFTLPIVLFGIFFKKYRDTDKLYPITGIMWIIIYIGAMLGRAIFSNESGVMMFPILLTFLFGILIFLSALSLVAVLLYGIISLVEYIKENRSYKTKPNNQSMIKIRFKAWKEKNCPIINWE